ncbi:hypothetical protein VTK73DRAFT_8653 [Phialemonium thermophilum]|uniref:Uncharacterized protein n=1 Tax=Phialemonium thermophilum TaxID=223376 RepID=A0ABR3XN05_9PEZI
MSREGSYTGDAGSYPADQNQRGQSSSGQQQRQDASGNLRGNIAETENEPHSVDKGTQTLQCPDTVPPVVTGNRDGHKIRSLYERAVATVHLDLPEAAVLPPVPKLKRHELPFFRRMLIDIIFLSETRFCARAPQTLMLQFFPHLPGFGIIAHAAWRIIINKGSADIPANSDFPDCRYIVVGTMGIDESVPHEVILPVRQRDNDDLFKQIRRAMRRVRAWHKRLMSLKKVSGFSLYECIPARRYHHVRELDGETRRAMAEFWKDFITLDEDYSDRWLNWVHKNFNNGSFDPEKGRYALQLVLRWSANKLIFWGAVPILLSLAVGFGYMFRPTTGEDFLTVVQTAWTISSYIITAAALALALTAVITQIGD